MARNQLRICFVGLFLGSTQAYFTRWTVQFDATLTLKVNKNLMLGLSKNFNNWCFFNLNVILQSTRQWSTFVQPLTLVKIYTQGSWFYLNMFKFFWSNVVLPSLKESRHIISEVLMNFSYFFSNTLSHKDGKIFTSNLLFRPHVHVHIVKHIICLNPKHNATKHYQRVRLLNTLYSWYP